MKQIRFGFGAILCIVELVEIIPAEILTIWSEYKIPKYEIIFGDYSPDRFAWITKMVYVLDEPLPISRKQGLWNFEMPLELERKFNDRPTYYK